MHMVGNKNDVGWSNKHEYFEVRTLHLCKRKVTEIVKNILNKCMHEKKREIISGLMSYFESLKPSYLQQKKF